MKKQAFSILEIFFALAILTVLISLFSRNFMSTPNYSAEKIKVDNDFSNVRNVLEAARINQI